MANLTDDADQDRGNRIAVMREIVDLSVIWNDLFADGRKILDRLEMDGSIELGEDETLIVRDTIDVSDVRSFVRAQTAAFEAVLYKLRQIALKSASVMGFVLTDEEVMAANERVPSVDKNGHVRTRPSFLTAESAFRMSFGLIARVHGSAINPDYGAAGWREYKSTIEIRNRLTHPKSSKDTIVSASELQEVFRAGLWFMRTYDDCIIDVNTKVRAQFGLDAKRPRVVRL